MIFVMAAATRYYGLGGFKNRNVLSYSSGVQKSKIQVLAGLLLLRAMKEGAVPCRSPWLVDGHLLAHIVLHVYVSMSKFPPSYKDSSHIGLEPTLKT